MDRDGFISNGELFLVLKMMVGNNLKVCIPFPPRIGLFFFIYEPSQDTQLQEIVDKTIMEADKDGDGKLSFEEFTQMVANTVRGPTLSPRSVQFIPFLGYREADDTRGPLLAICHLAFVALALIPPWS